MESLKKLNCGYCPSVHLPEWMVHFMNHEHTVKPHGAAATGNNRQDESCSDDGSSTSTLDISGFIMETLQVLRDIRDVQRTNFRALSAQIVNLQGELGQVRKKRISQFFPISNVDQLERIDEICEQIENYPHSVELRKTLETYCRDENVTCNTGFYRIFDETFALQLVVKEQDAPSEYISLSKYKSFYKLLNDTWKLCNGQGKRIDRNLRYFLRLNRKRLFEPNHHVTTEFEIRNSCNKRANSDSDPTVSEPIAKRRNIARVVPEQRHLSGRARI